MQGLTQSFLLHGELIWFPALLIHLFLLDLDSVCSGSHIWIYFFSLASAKHRAGLHEQHLDLTLLPAILLPQTLVSFTEG